MTSLYWMKKHVLTFFLVYALTFSMFGLIFSNLHFYAQASDGEWTSISVVPTINSANPSPAPISGQWFTINFTVTNVTNLYSWGLTLDWGQIGLLTTTAANITEGNFLNQGVPSHSTFQKTVGTKSINIAAALLSTSYPRPNGTGTLATAAFKALRSGNCTLTLTSTTLRGYNASAPPAERVYSIPHSLQNGAFFTTFPVAAFTMSPDPGRIVSRPLVDEIVTFNGTSSYDPDQANKSQSGRGIASYSWDFGDGSPFGSGNITTHVYTEPASRTVRLNVTDDDGETYFIEKTFVVQLHDITVANLTVTPKEVLAGNTITINATILNKGSVSEHFNITAFFNYFQINMTTRKSLPIDQNVSVVFNWNTTGVALGNYTVGVNTFLVDQLTLASRNDEEANPFDNSLIDGEVTIVGAPRHDLAVTDVQVDPTNLRINAESNIEVTVANQGNANEHYNVTITVKYGSEETIISPVSWSNQTVYPGTSTKLSYRFITAAGNTTREGAYNITATVVLINATTGGFSTPYNATVPDDDPTDNTRSTSPLPIIQVYPIAYFDNSPAFPTVINVDATVTFNGTKSYTPGIPGGTITQYFWDFGDGARVTLSTPVVSHVYRSNGLFTVTLRVTDDVSLVGNTSKTLTIAPFRNIDIVNATFSPNIVSSGEQISMSVVVNNRFFTQNFSLTSYFNDNEIGSELNTTMQMGEFKTFTFVWDTTGVSAGNYTIKAITTTILRNATSGEYYTNVEDTCIAGIVTVQKLSVAITLTATKTVFNAGESTTLSGSSSPALSTTDLSILYKLNDEITWNTLATQATNADGTYSYTWTPPNAGTYTIKISWEGNAAMMGESQELVVIATEAPQLNLFMFTTIILIIAIIGVAAYFLKFRKL
jgi:hypothetical protein